MADHTNTSRSPASAEASPSSDISSGTPSSNASPVSAPPSLYMDMARPSAEPESSGMQIPAAAAPHAHADVTRSPSAGKGGCWWVPVVLCVSAHADRPSRRTCRLRRKVRAITDRRLSRLTRRQKCDEERDAADGACKTCRRLSIECLGWGAKRPDWMRVRTPRACASAADPPQDKEKVAAYKASIKDQLTRAGLIRGQPRSTYIHAVHSPPGVAGPGPSSLAHYPHPHAHDGRYAHPPVRSWTSPPPRNASGSVHAIPGGSVSERTSPTNLHLPFHHNQAMDPLSSFHSQTYGAYSPASVSPTIPADEHARFEQPPFPAPSPAVTHEELMMYYFECVRKGQYVFAGNSLTNLLYNIVAAEPTGAVANTVGALASHHLTRARIVAQGLDPATAQEMPLTKQYYESAWFQLVQNKQMHGQYTETDAVAAVQLVSFSLFSGAWRDWGAELEVACDWLAQTRIHEEQNPKMTLLSMTPVARFAAKATMWIDVLSSITYMQPPRFLSLYRRLFGGSAGGFWANTRQEELRMDPLTGCPDEALLALAEISALAHWKAAEQRMGSLSVRELMRRGDQIEKALIAQRAVPRVHGEGSRTPLDQHLSAALVGGLPAVPDVVSREEASGLVGEIFCESALLYLHTVLSDPYPGVPEVSSSVTNLVTLLGQLNPSEYDRALVFPLFLMGCMTDDVAVHDAVRQRLLRLDDKFGNIHQVVHQLDRVWHYRIASAQRGLSEPVRWRESLHHQMAHIVLL
ncbi:hypothetical protein WOLCODRAFT_29530 [Wolfiporia cocos MD-104 SS10]|uniref:Zn(2)-C6 fungal-type domain-containing protein n=1 Tax=Wolfiporia cocos (strain MD-104) TaxID=742152 RepID=A0A2H3JNT1_WOLCO|nr:hypothetical protein WOLCODRAFT_29530 [Wolfiporia cocos MD-104 SS10]